MNKEKVVDIIEIIYKSASKEFVKSSLQIVPEPKQITYSQKVAG